MQNVVYYDFQDSTLSRLSTSRFEAWELPIKRQSVADTMLTTNWTLLEFAILACRRKIVANLLIRNTYPPTWFTKCKLMLWWLLTRDKTALRGTIPALLTKLELCWWVYGTRTRQRQQEFIPISMFENDNSFLNSLTLVYSLAAEGALINAFLC